MLDHVLKELAIEVDALRGIERLDLVVREHPRIDTWCHDDVSGTN